MQFWRGRPGHRLCTQTPSQSLPPPSPPPHTHGAYCHEKEENKRVVFQSLGIMISDEFECLQIPFPHPPNSHPHTFPHPPSTSLTLPSHCPPPTPLPPHPLVASTNPVLVQNQDPRRGHTCTLAHLLLNVQKWMMFFCIFFSLSHSLSLLPLTDCSSRLLRLSFWLASRLGLLPAR